MHAVERRLPSMEEVSMATKEQYEFFRFLYESEERIYQYLEARAKFYLSIISLFLAALLLKAEEVRTSAAAYGIPWWILTLVAAVLAVAIVLVVLATRIRRYEAVADPQKVVDSFGDIEPTNKDFFDDRIADLTVATMRNSAVNHRVANILLYTNLCLALAMLVLLASLVFSFSP